MKFKRIVKYAGIAVAAYFGAPYIAAAATTAAPYVGLATNILGARAQGISGGGGTVMVGGGQPPLIQSFSLGGSDGVGGFTTGGGGFATTGGGGYGSDIGASGGFSPMLWLAIGGGLLLTVLMFAFTRR